MKYVSEYLSPLGKILISATETALCGVWFFKQKYFAEILDDKVIQSENDIIQKTKKWLDIYFEGKNPQFKIPIKFYGTDFQIKVWNILKNIPYGKTITYGEIAKILEQNLKKKMSCQAVGGAIKKNNISIIIPCHRVIGRNNLVGYAGGLDKKKKLLELEKVNLNGKV